MTENNKCESCEEKFTRSYDYHNVCEYHYLLLNPKRNAMAVLWRLRDTPPWKIKNKVGILEALNKYLPLETIEEELYQVLWYERLKKEGLFP